MRLRPYVFEPILRQVWNNLQNNQTDKKTSDRGGYEDIMIKLHGIDTSLSIFSIFNERPGIMLPKRSDTLIND